MSTLKMIEGQEAYTYFHQEIKLVSEEVTNLDDEALVDECYSILMQFPSSDLDKIMNYYEKHKSLTSTQRKSLEGFYILAYTELCWSDNGQILHIR